jgi:putative serine protease PepD
LTPVRASREMEAAGRHQAALGGLAVFCLAGLLLVGVPMSIGWTLNAAELNADRQSISKLQARLGSLEGQIRAETNWTAIAGAAQSSVFTIATSTGLGSGWVARSDPGGSDLVTNFHVVAEAWNAGEVKVQVRQGDRSMDGTITRVEGGEDLAIVHITQRFPALRTAPRRPQLGDAVLAVGSPLGLGGSVSLGMISGFRSLEGADYIQFSAPTSPGNSGGPVLDRQGRVVAVIVAKFEGQGVEALSLAIPVQTVCAIITCAPFRLPGVRDARPAAVARRSA